MAQLVNGSCVGDQGVVLVVYSRINATMVI